MLLIHQNFKFCILLRNVILTENKKKNMMNNYSIIGVCFLAQLAVKKLLTNSGHIYSLTGVITSS